MPATDIADVGMLAQSGADMILLAEQDALAAVSTNSKDPSIAPFSAIKYVDRACVAAECMLESHSPSEPISPRISSKPLTDVEALLHGAAAAAVDCSAGKLKQPAILCLQHDFSCTLHQQVDLICTVMMHY